MVHGPLWYCIVIENQIVSKLGAISLSTLTECKEKRIAAIRVWVGVSACAMQQHQTMKNRKTYVLKQIYFAVY